MSNLFETLEERGLIYQYTDKQQVKQLLNGKTTVYCGIDPTADSLHIGHCFPLIVLRDFQNAGHKVIIVVGGATAMIGDPSGKTDMRKMVDSDFVNGNMLKIKEIIGKFLQLDGDNPAIILNNADWFKGYDYIDFMRDIGVHFNIAKMLSADAYARRLEQGGLTFFEMGYMLMQAYDFVYLNRNYGCALEIGGSDQWTNILAGADLGRKLNFLDGKDEDAFQALTTPLLTNKDGVKMGKTEKGALWVDKSKTSAYEFYQYFYNLDDKDVEKVLLFLTRISVSEIKTIMQDDIRNAKSRMAYEVTKFVHGENEAKTALTTAQDMFKNMNMENAPTVKIEATSNLPITDLCVLVKLCGSKSEVRRLIEQGGLLLDNEKVNDYNLQITIDDIKRGVVLKKGKKTYLKVIAQ